MVYSFLHGPLYRQLKQKRIGVLMGGRSAEREVSLMSGRGVLSALKRMGFSTVGIDAVLGVERKLVKEKIDIAFLALHGRWGEDGTVQGLLEFMNIPYTGSGVHASALAMNKISSKRIFQAVGIPTPAFVTLDLSGDLAAEADKSGKALGFPLFIKPYNEGSSIGCHIARNKAELVKAMRLEKATYPRMFAEKFIQGKELTVGVLERDRDRLVLPVLELSPKSAFYDYKAKYTDGLTDFIFPADISARAEAKVKQLTLAVHEALNCHGFSRTDFILEKRTGRLWVLELNTLPGLTALSDIPAEARAAGITYDELVFHILCSSLTIRRSMKQAVYYD
ncbi:MAG: D-alanine--D-alanine ligase [Fibrobacterota bacterium]